MKIITRRKVLSSTMLAGASVLATGRGLRAALASQQRRAPIVETTYGKLRGTTHEGVNAFKGIPYGASTASENRFMSPRKPAAWAGIHDALYYRPWAMQPESESFPYSGTTALDREIQVWYQGLSTPRPAGEDCLVLNVWCPESAQGRKRPVMVWLHGGGFEGGSGDWGWADGSNLARKHDVVVVSVNHRLNIFGFLYLADLGGAKYSDSGNAGMLDIVAALQWVRENIGSFRGDPDNVTIFGQSGGGGKVDVLMAMPSAQGLFHKAINMSGPGLRMLSRDQATQTAVQVLHQLGIDRGEVDKLQQVPGNLLVETYLKDPSIETDWRNGTHYRAFAPVVDHRSLPRHPFDPDAPAISAQIPMIFGNCGDESRTAALLAAVKSEGAFDDRAIQTDLEKRGIEGSRAARLISAYRAPRPGAAAIDIFSAILSDLSFRMDAITMAERKAALRKAPAYMYLFTWDSPVFGGKYKSSHSSDMPFVFDNLDKAPGMRGPNPDRREFELARNISRSFAAFAHSGNPNHAGLPQWKPYAGKDRATMIFNYACELVDDPGRGDRLAMEALGLKSDSN